VVKRYAQGCLKDHVASAADAYAPQTLTRSANSCMRPLNAQQAALSEERLAKTNARKKPRRLALGASRRPVQFWLHR